jgi:hypothetical protein
MVVRSVYGDDPIEDTERGKERETQSRKSEE